MKENCSKGVQRGLKDSKEEFLFEEVGGIINPELMNSECFKELHNSLTSLGYEDLEIRRAFKAIVSEYKNNTNQAEPSFNTLNDPDNLLRVSLIWLTREAA